MKLDLNKIQNELTDIQVINIMKSFSDDEYADKGNCIIFKTICHNDNLDEASMKLYYYKKNKRFHCYTECGDTFNIFELIRRVFKTRTNEDISFKQCLDYFISVTNYDTSTAAAPSTEHYVSKLDKYKKRQRTIELPNYSGQLLNVFSKVYPQEWLDEGIGRAAMDKYNIRYSISQNKIIIPHYDVNGDLIGIRGRALDPIEVEVYGKYMPVKVENKLYAHPLSQNLYGLNYNMAAISNTKKVILYEAEKSVLMHETYFDINNSVAICGSNFNKVQLELLLKNTTISEIILALDKEYSIAASKEADKYFDKLMSICKKYNNYCNMSFIFDRENLLQTKDSPIDKGKDIFMQLYQKRIKTWKEM